MKQSKLIDRDTFFELIGTDNLANMVTLDRREDHDIILRFLTGDIEGATSKQVRLNTGLAQELRRMLNDELDEDR